MKSREALWEICMEIYRQMYKEATPSADFDELVRTKVTQKERWFMQYYLPQERQTEIISSTCAKHKLSKREIRIININVVLGSAPTEVKKSDDKK